MARVIASLAVAAAIAVVVVNACSGDPSISRPPRRSSWPACWRRRSSGWPWRAGPARRLDPAGRCALGRRWCCSATGSPGWATGAGRRRGRALAGAVPVAAGAGLRVPGRRAAVAALAAGVARSRSARRRVLLILLGEPERDAAVPSPLPCDSGAGVPLFWVCWAGLLASLFAGAAALRARYRAGDAVLRRQVLWLAYGALLIPLWLGGDVAAGRLVARPIADGVLTLLQAWPAVAVAIAVTRHGLYSIDRLVNRTLVYARPDGAAGRRLRAASSLLAGLVVGGSALTASLATLAAALAVPAPARRLQRARRPPLRAPALRRGAAAARLPRRGARRARRAGGRRRRAARSRSRDPGAEIVFRLPETAAYADRHGRLVELPDDGRERVGDRARPRRARSTPRSRPTCCAACWTRRPCRSSSRGCAWSCACSWPRWSPRGRGSRRPATRSGGGIERDLHDGAQQRLVTLGIVLRRLQRSLPREAQVLVPALDAAVDEVAAAIADLRTIAAGVRPPRLDEGLAAALADLARGAAIPVEVAATRATARRPRSRPPRTSSPARR